MKPKKETRERIERPLERGVRWQAKNEREQAEKEANHFAVCLLMPERLVMAEVDRMGGSIDLVDDKKIKTLAKLFQVPDAMMAMRLMQIYRGAKAI